MDSPQNTIYEQSIQTNRVTLPLSQNKENIQNKKHQHRETK